MKLALAIGIALALLRQRIGQGMALGAILTWYWMR